MAHAKDPVCGMTVDTDNAQWTSHHDGTTWYFCAASCKEQFDANPANYVGDARAESAERHEPPFTVSGGVAAPKFGAAGSGGAEYEMLPEAHDKH